MSFHKSIMIFLNLKPETSGFLAQTPLWFLLPGRQSPRFLAWCQRPPESGTDITFGLIPSLSHPPFASYTILDCLLFSPDHLHLYTFPSLILLEECLLSPKVTSTGKFPGPSPHPKLTILSQRNWDLLDHNYSGLHVCPPYQPTP